MIKSTLTYAFLLGLYHRLHDFFCLNPEKDWERWSRAYGRGVKFADWLTGDRHITK